MILRHWNLEIMEFSCYYRWQFSIATNVLISTPTTYLEYKRPCLQILTRKTS